MVEVKPINILCSSEDPAFPAINLVRGAYKSFDERKLWLCADPAEQSAFVILKYAEPFHVTSIEFKNYNSPIVQVQGSNSVEGTHFQTLWRAVNCISHEELRNGTNIDGTYSLLSQDIMTSEKNKKWDTLKIICYQPFTLTNKFQYGLSYVIVRTTLPVKEEPSSAVKEEPLVGETNREINIGTGRCPFGLVPSIKVLGGTVPSGSVAVVKEEASSTDDARNESNSAKVSEAPIIEIQDSSEDEDDDDDDSQETSNVSSMKRKLPDQESPTQKRPRPASVTFKPFNQLLEGVKIVISGFVNPERAEIRQRALKMGAKYSPYWSGDSTHLICAFLYTPKYRQALGEGLIVTRQWVDECFSQRKRLHWRRFALNMGERLSFDSNETEVWELLPGPNAGVTSSGENSSTENGVDTQSEESVSVEQSAGCSTSSTSTLNTSTIKTEPLDGDPCPSSELVDGVSSVATTESSTSISTLQPSPETTTDTCP